MDPNLPNFLIIGAARSGTTSLWQYLRSHPDVFVPAEKELDFFSGDRYGRGLAWYADQFTPGVGKKAIGEASPQYLFSEDAPARTADAVPDARLIAILRNPIDRAYSHYLHARLFARERRTFRRAVDEERKASDGKLFPFYLAMGRYQPQLVRWARSFPREQILVLLFDELRKDPAGVFTKICDHISIDATVIPANVGAASNTYNEWRAPSLVRFLSRPAIRERLPQKPWYSFLRMMVRKGSKPPPIEPDLRDELIAYFAEDNALLASWLGRDLEGWR